MILKCKCCSKANDYQPSDFQWDYNGYGYDTKFVTCKNCGKIIVLKYNEHQLDINNDGRFYYKEKCE